MKDVRGEKKGTGKEAEGNEIAVTGTCGEKRGDERGK